MIQRRRTVMQTEPRTIREARERIRELESEINAVRLSPAMAGLFAPWWLKDAQAKLRKFEREAAKHDDPRLPALKPMDPVVERRTPLPGAERRRKYRCSGCLMEHLFYPSSIDRDPDHHRAKRNGDGDLTRWTCGTFEPVARLPRGKASV